MLSDEEKKDFEDALDDVHTRFILNLPAEELKSSDRMFFQLEQAFWFYDDFYCDSNDALPRYSNLKPFALKIFRVSPLLQPNLKKFEFMWEEFCAYKRTISTFGTILLNAECNKALLCQSYNSKSWTFPAGKVNQNETGIQAAARETYEETGFDCVAHGLELREENALVYVEEGTKKRRTCYVCVGVQEDFPFEPIARKEVGDIDWFEIGSLPKKTFAVLPFIAHLRRWIKKRQKQAIRTARSASRSSASTPNKQRDRSSKKPRSNSKNHSERKSSRKKNRDGSRSGSGIRGRVKEGDNVTTSCLANVGDEDGWTEADMFLANENILGKKIEYNGNPHEFAELSKGDPHRFHVVGGEYLNTPNHAKASIVSPPKPTDLQPLLCSRQHDSDSSGRELEPFFSVDGSDPWGEMLQQGVMANENQSVPEIGNASGISLLNRLTGGNNNDHTTNDDVVRSGVSALNKSSYSFKDEIVKGAEILPPFSFSNGGSNVIADILPLSVSSSPSISNNNTDEDTLFLTDSLITARSQKKKTAVSSTNIPAYVCPDTIDSPKLDLSLRKSSAENDKYDDIVTEDFQYLRKWAESKRYTPSTETFGDFKFNVDRIMDAMRDVSLVAG